MACLRDPSKLACKSLLELYWRPKRTLLNLFFLPAKTFRAVWPGEENLLNLNSLLVTASLRDPSKLVFPCIPCLQNPTRVY